MNIKRVFSRAKRPVLYFLLAFLLINTPVFADTARMAPASVSSMNNFIS